MTVVRAAQSLTSQDWLLDVEGEVTLEVERGLYALGALNIRGGHYAVSRAATAADVELHLGAVCNLFINGKRVSKRPLCGTLHLWAEGAHWVLQLDHDPRPQDHVVMGVMLSASQDPLVQRRFRVSSLRSRQEILDVIRDFYDVVEQKPPEQARDKADAGQTVRRAYERWCRTNGFEPNGGWQTQEGPGGSGSRRGWSPWGDPDFFHGYTDPFGDARRRQEREARERREREQRQAPPRDEYRAPPRRGDATDPYRAMLEGLPHATLKKIYRLIAVEHHPDKGGDGELLKRVNAAWDRLKKQLGIT